MSSSKEIDRRTFLKGAGFTVLSPGCFLGRNTWEIVQDVSLIVAMGGLAAGLEAKSLLSKSSKITRREFWQITRAGSLGAVYGLVLGEGSRWWERRREVQEFLNSLPAAPKENIKITELSLLELADLINRLEGKIPTPEEADVLIAATAYQAAQFLGESPAKAKEYIRGLFKIFDEREIQATCQPDADKDADTSVACVKEFSMGRLLAVFNFSQEEWQRLFATEMPIRSFVGTTAHEVAHMHVRRLEVFPNSCDRPREDYGVLGKSEVFSRRGFIRSLLPPKGEILTVDGRDEEEFFAEWTAHRFLNELEEFGLERRDYEPMGYLEFEQAIINLEYTRPGANWPKWWQGRMDFNRVAKLHWENDLWRFRRDLGEVMLDHSQEFILSPPKLSEANKAALGMLAFREFVEIKEDLDRFERLLQISSEEELLDL